MHILFAAAFLLLVLGLVVRVAIVGLPEPQPRRYRGPSLYEVGGVVAGAVALHHFHENHQYSERLGHEIERAQHLAALDAPFGTFEYYQAQQAHLHHYR